MLRNTLTLMIGIAAAGLIAAPIASADSTDLTNADIAGTQTTAVVDSLLPIFPSTGGPHPYATGYNISPRYEFTTDPVTGDRRAKYDDGCNGAC